jgi:hypothetical protein
VTEFLHHLVNGLPVGTVDELLTSPEIRTVYLGE